MGTSLTDAAQSRPLGGLQITIDAHTLLSFCYPPPPPHCTHLSPLTPTRRLLVPGPTPYSARVMSHLTLAPRPVTVSDRHTRNRAHSGCHCLHPCHGPLNNSASGAAGDFRFTRWVFFFIKVWNLESVTTQRNCVSQWRSKGGQGGHGRRAQAWGGGGGAPAQLVGANFKKKIRPRQISKVTSLQCAGLT